MKGFLLLSLFISLIALIMIVSVYIYYITPVSEFSFETTALVTEDLAGFDLNSTAVTFGSVAVGGSSTRSILVNNSYSFPITIKPEIEGDISKLITYEPIMVGPNEEARFYFTLSADSFDKLGSYDGKITMKLLRA